MGDAEDFYLMHRFSQQIYMDTKLTISFKPLSSLQSGQLFEMLADSYIDLIEKDDVRNRDKYIESWAQMDRKAFDSTEPMGKYILVTHLDGKSIGFASYDPRYFPQYGIIGQNCIRSEFKGKGYGRIQIEEILKLFKLAGCHKVIVSTGNINFFIPAQKMYKSLGFEEIGRQLNQVWGYQEIKYEMLLR